MIYIHGLSTYSVFCIMSCIYSGDIVDTAVVGKYVVSFSVSDTAGNSAQAVRKVQIVECFPPPPPLDLIAPVITLNGM